MGAGGDGEQSSCKILTEECREVTSVKAASPFECRGEF